MRSGLAAASASVTVCFCGPPGDFDLPPWATAVELGPDLSLGECPTLRGLWDRAKADPAGLAWYAHTKGVSRPGNANVAAWRRYLAHFTLDRWQDAPAALRDRDAAGVDWIEPGDDWWEPYPVPSRAFLGNFWWARLDYLARLPADRVDLSRSRWSAEWDFVGAGDPRVRVFHRSRRNLYAEAIDPASYRG